MRTFRVRKNVATFKLRLTLSDRRTLLRLAKAFGVTRSEALRRLIRECKTLGDLLG